MGRDITSLRSQGRGFLRACCLARRCVSWKCGRVCDRTEEIDRGTLEEGFPDGKVLIEI